MMMRYSGSSTVLLCSMLSWCSLLVGFIVRSRVAPVDQVIQVFNVFINFIVLVFVLQVVMVQIVSWF